MTAQKDAVANKGTIAKSNSAKTKKKSVNVRMPRKAAKGPQAWMA